MWLLNTTTLKLSAFAEDPPHYIILSHTWGQDEVSFYDINDPHVSSKAGYSKILGCCRQARSDGFEWAWIDTCCIDKRSSTELSEAINSMYTWYWNAAICYVYLQDVPSFDHLIEQSRWFTRGWTLQELLAPELVEFYDCTWLLLGSKVKLLDSVVKATGIEKAFILDRESVKGATVSTKFSWAASRKTTRVEDMAYCLLGLLQVNMPMLYGEGDRAFFRLQLEIIKQTNDHSIFAWNPPDDDSEYTAVLAPSPLCFSNAANLSRAMMEEATTYEVTNNGLRITLPAIEIDQNRIIALLDCVNDQDNIVGVWLEKFGNQYRRLTSSKLTTVSHEEFADAKLKSMFLVVVVDREKSTTTPNKIAIAKIKANHAYLIDGIIHRTPTTATYVYNPFTYPASQNDSEVQLNHLFDQVLGEGEVTFFRLWLSEPFNFEISVLFGIWKDRPLLGSLGSRFFAIPDWDFGMHSDDYGSLYDFAKTLRTYNGDTLTLCLAARRQREPNGSLHWNLTISTHLCKCKGNITDAFRSSECTCPPLRSRVPDKPPIVLPAAS